MASRTVSGSGSSRLGNNQEHELRQAEERAGWQVAKVYKDHGISGAKGRNGRPAFDTLCGTPPNANST